MNNKLIVSMLGLGASALFAQDTTAVASTVEATALAGVTESIGAVSKEVAAAQETASNALFTANNVWMLVSTVLVFIMHLGFSMIEVGMTRAKNTVNILFKNVSIVAIGTLTYAICGFNLMYPGGDFAGGFFGFAGFTSRSHSLLLLLKVFNAVSIAVTIVLVFVTAALQVAV